MLTLAIVEIPELQPKIEVSARIREIAFDNFDRGIEPARTSPQGHLGYKRKSAFAVIFRNEHGVQVQI